MKKRFALGLLLCGMMMNVFAAQVLYFMVSNNTNVDGQAFCDSAWPGSTYHGVRMGNAEYYYVACMK
ncbi:hypothetical protein N8I74_09425 [Chitiniphilus purpureus]|uniref:Uncharacterized protein n=1 Tax=Chitiniphilus purpureus TaxID=2981137 RepID=A0ABY6DT56_9NEIS|nr:hypothetical protein [Chitiniphilus sp. CD1]UXY17207.1 hypothetical protein N8I74_09425 [Chitiniphilus sp. CD1]